MEYYKNYISIIKDISSIITPIVLIFIGAIINLNLQRQNKISDRNAHIAKLWADDFAKIIKSINDLAVSILFAYWALKNAKILKPDDGIEIFSDTISNNLSQWVLDLKRYGCEIEPFAVMAKENGESFTKAFLDLDNYLYNWMRNRGGNIDELRRLQINFNVCAWEMHAELIKRSV